MVCFANDSFRRLFPSDFEVGDLSANEKSDLKSLNHGILDKIWEDLQGKPGLVRDIAFNSERGRQLNKSVHIIPGFDRKARLSHHVWVFHPVREADVAEPVPVEFE
jgi:hypothetical protein